MRRPCLTCGRLIKSGSSYAAHRPYRGGGWSRARLRARVFAVYGRRWADSGRSDVPAEAHHVNGDPTDNRIRNLIPLCRDCHHEATFPGI